MKISRVIWIFYTFALSRTPSQIFLHHRDQESFHPVKDQTNEVPGGPVAFAYETGVQVP